MSGYGPTVYDEDVNQLGSSRSKVFAVNQQAPYKDGVVEDIILNETHPEYDKVNGANIGMAKIRIIPDDRNASPKLLNWFMPLDTTIREYPLKNEMVMIFYSLGRMFYTRRVNITNKITESSWPGLAGKFSPQEKDTIKNQNIILAAQGGPAYRPWGTQQSKTLGDEFAENPSVKMVRPNEGDAIIQGRFGNIIRFGSSLFSNPVTSKPQPNLLITVGQSTGRPGSTSSNNSPYTLVYEDINKDRSCIWMVTNEEVVLEPATINSPAHLRSSTFSKSDQYTGAQIFINSDRVILNSKLNEISLFSKKEINLSAIKAITLDSEDSVQITATKDIKLQSENDVLIKGKTISFITHKELSMTTTENYTISGKKIFIGSSGAEDQPMVLGAELALWLQSLVSLLSVDLVRAFITLDPATFAAKMAELSIKLSPGAPKLAVFNSFSNFTSKTND